MVTAVELSKISKKYIDKNHSKAGFIVLIDILLFLLLIVFIIASNNYFIKTILSLILGLNIGFLFIVGHDCCHNSFTSSKRINKLIGVLAFLPSLHNFKLWELGHNKTHHTFTNLKSKDYVYTPLSVQEYNSLSQVAKYQYRVYRSIIGHLFYYLIEIWFKKMIWPIGSIPNIKSRDKYIKYSVYLLMYLVILIGFLVILSTIFDANIYSSIVFCFLIPFLFWNWLMGFVIYQHHTNPITRWYKNEEEWEYWECQLGESTHIKFPKPLNTILHNIMEHTAHHCDMRIPLYNLNAAQTKIEEKFKGKIQIINWNFRFYLDSISSCKLYDYDNHKWLDFKNINCS